MSDLVTIKLFSTNDSQRKMELKQAKALYNNNYSQFFDQAVTAHTRGIEYWDNFDNHISGILENKLIKNIPQTIPMRRSALFNVLRPQDVQEKKKRIDAYVRNLRGTPEAGDDKIIDAYLNNIGYGD